MFVTNPHYVYINSRDRLHGTDENFTYNINFPDGLDFTHVVCLNVLVPKSYYLIQSGGVENILFLQENATTVTVTVPIGSYLLNSFRTTLSTLLTAASPNGLTYTLTYPALSGADTGKWTYTQTNGAIQSSIIVNEHFFEPLGFFSGSTNLFTGTTLVSTCVIKLQSEDRLIIHSNIAANPTIDDVLISINSTTSINYSSIAWDNPAPEFYSHLLSSQRNNVYSFSLTDENGELIQLNGLNMNLTLLLYRKSYRHQAQFSNTFGQAINLGASQTPVTINIPPTVFNMAQSYLNYTVNIPPASTGNYIWYARQALREISHIQWYAGSNMFIVDIDNLQNYLDITMKKELDAEEFRCLSDLTGVSVSNSVINNIPAFRNSNVAVANVPNLGANPSSVNYNEPGYFEVSALNGPVAYTVQFPLRFIKNSAFSMDKNVYLGQTSYLKVYFGPMSKIAYMSDSNANPSAGIKASYAAQGGLIPTIGGPITVPLNATVSPINFQLMLAVETNQDLRTVIINEVTTQGQTYNIPYVQAFKNNNNGGSQTISIQVDQGNGQHLMKVYHVPYNQQEDLDTMYDHSNNGTVAGAYSVALNQKVQQYYTQLNGQREQDITIDCTPAGPFTDYMTHRKQLRGSIISNLNVYQYNWFHCSDYTDFGAKYDQDNKGELIAGIPMSVSPLTWSFVGTVMRPALSNFNHYSWFVFVKRFSMSLGTVTVQ